MIQKDKDNVQEIRKKIFLSAYTGTQSGVLAHLASAFSVVELMYALYHKKILTYDAANPEWADRDRFILSKGHAGLALYVSLAENGFFQEEELSTFLQPGSRIGGEPCLNGLPGVEATSGSLGHGLSMGVGMALAAKLDHKDYKTYVVLGDGECQEGTIWEAVMSAHKYRLDNLTAIVDYNKVQKMGFIVDTMRISEWKNKWESFGWKAEEIKDGHDVDEICEVLQKQNDSGEPRVILLNTVKGKGVSCMENNAAWHFKMPNKRELKRFMEELNITEEELNRCRGLI